MIWGFVFIGLLLGGIAIVWRIGGPMERAGIGIILFNALATFAVIALADARWENLELAVLFLDAMAFAAFATIAMRSNRFWPIWVTGLQLAQITTHLARMADPVIMPKAYEAGQGLWAWLQIAIIAYSAWQMHQNETPRRSPD